MNILIVKTSAIGDVTHTLPALSALRRRYPRAGIDWLVEEAAEGILLGHPDLDRVLTVPRKTWLRRLRSGDRAAALREILSFVRRLRRTEYDLVIDFQNLLKSGVWVALARSGRKVGFGPGMEHSELSWVFLDVRVRAVSMDLHAAERERLLLEAIGVPCRGVRGRLPLDPESRDRARGLLGSAGITDRDRTVAVNPMAKWPTKLWRAERFAVLADRISGETGAKIVFTGSAEDRGAVGRIRSLMRAPCADFTGRTDLRALAAVYERCAVVVATDTGPMHLAAAVGTPVVALFGPTAPWRTGPIGPGHRVIRAGAECSPCFRRHCPDPVCMDRITEDQVLAGVLAAVSPAEDS